MGAQLMNFCEIFAPELRTYVLIVGMGVRIAFAHIPPIYICKRMSFFQHFSACLQIAETIYKRLLSLSESYRFYCHRFSSRQTAVDTACLRGGEATLTGSKASITFQCLAS